MTTRRKEEILEEVDELAELALKVNPDLTIEQARGLAWDDEEIYAEWRDAAPEPARPAVSKSAKQMSVADACAEAVHNEADRQYLRIREDRTVEKIRGDLWESPEGERLYQLARSDSGREAYSGYTPVRKSLEFGDAWALLHHWLR